MNLLYQIPCLSTERVRASRRGRRLSGGTKKSTFPGSVYFEDGFSSRMGNAFAETGRPRVSHLVALKWLVYYGLAFNLNS
jgi:hypothetical protein